MTALLNHDVPVAAVTTPQFMRCQKEIERRTSWTSEQFIGRIGHFERLPPSLSEADLRAVAGALLVGADKRSIKALVLYAQASAKYLAGIDTVICRAEYLAEKDGRERVDYRDIKRAITEGVIPLMRPCIGRWPSQPGRPEQDLQGPCNPQSRQKSFQIRAPHNTGLRHSRRSSLRII